MTVRPAARRWMLIVGLLLVVAIAVCAVAVARAGQVAPVFVWPGQAGTEIVLTRQQYESALIAQQVGRVAAVAAVGLAIATAVLARSATGTPRTP